MPTRRGIGRRRPSASITVRLRTQDRRKCDLHHTPFDGKPGADQGHAEGRGRIVTPTPHARFHEQVEAPPGPERQASVAGPAAPGAKWADRSGATSQPLVTAPGARTDRAGARRPGQGRGGAGGADRPCREPRYLVAGDRRQARRDQAGGPPALPAAPPRWRQP